MHCTTPPSLYLRVDANADRTTTVRLAGGISSAELPMLRRTIECLGGTGPLIFDLSEVAYVDSAAVDLLFEVANDRGLELILGPGCAVFSVIQVSGLDQVATLRSVR